MAGSPDVVKFRFGSKAQTLARIRGSLGSAVVLPMHVATIKAWRADAAAETAALAAQRWAVGPLIVRSSAHAEDANAATMAGAFCSVGPVGLDEVPRAVAQVADSIGALRHAGDEVLIQPWLDGIASSGVATSCHPTTGSRYTIVTWAEDGSSDAVTSGRAAATRTWYTSTGSGPEGTRVEHIAALVDEVVRVTGSAAVELEFAVTESGATYLLQVRRLTGVNAVVEAELQGAAIAVARDAIAVELRRDTVLGAMPDWNPAEIIGVRPRRLARSLYGRLITDSAWAEARARYGYRVLNPTPLLRDVAGHTFVDVRTSLESLLPAGLPEPAAEAIVAAQLDRLRDDPSLHDKVEFEVAISAPRFGADNRVAALLAAGVSRADVDLLTTNVARVCERLITTGQPWRNDLDATRSLDATCEPGPEGVSTALTTLVADGTRPFAGVARAAFVATDLLRGLFDSADVDAADRSAFFGSLGTVAAMLGDDFAKLGREEFLERYAHLRPGTYDVRSPRYGDAPERYFARRSVDAGWAPATDDERTFGRAARLRMSRVLAQGPLDVALDDVLAFAAETIRGRELAKLRFTKLLSDVLEQITEIGARAGLTREDLSFVDIADVVALQALPEEQWSAALARSADTGRRGQALADIVELPLIITDARQADAHEALRSEPNFVTTRVVRAPAIAVDSQRWEPGAIAVVESADPGYDWLFTQGAVGLVTAYGGANSHMAIRAGELDIPAAIGVGFERFRQLRVAAVIELDAQSRLIRTYP